MTTPYRTPGERALCVCGYRPNFYVIRVHIESCTGPMFDYAVRDCAEKEHAYFRDERTAIMFATAMNAWFPDRCAQHEEAP